MSLKTDWNAGADLANLPYGMIYIVKGPSDKLAWELREVPNLQVLFSVSNDTLNGLITCPSLFNASTEYKNYLVYYSPTLKFNLDVKVWARTRVFVWLTSLTGEFTRSNAKNTTQEKFYKLHSGNCFKQIDLCSVSYREDPCLLKLIEQYKQIDKVSLSLALDLYAQHPLKLHYLLTTQTLEHSTYIKEVLLFRSALTRLADSPPNYSAVIELSNLPSHILNDLLIKPNLKHTKLYKILAFSESHLAEAITCRDLWFWYELFMLRIPRRYYKNSRYIVRLFFTWVYNSTRWWADFNNKGFNIFLVGRKPIYAFNPSARAIKEFYSLFS